jgi:hypothetical protein
MPRPRTDNSLTTSLRLSPDLHEKLDAARGDRPLGEEIRNRLAASFDERARAHDPMTAATLESIANAAKIISQNYGDWHIDPGANAVFRRAVEILVHRVAGDPEVKPTAQANPMFQGKDVETAANMVAAAANVLW